MYIYHFNFELLKYATGIVVFSIRIERNRNPTNLNQNNFCKRLPAALRQGSAAPQKKIANAGPASTIDRVMQ